MRTTKAARVGVDGLIAIGRRGWRDKLFVHALVFHSTDLQLGDSRIHARQGRRRGVKIRILRRGLDVGLVQGLLDFVLHTRLLLTQLFQFGLDAAELGAVEVEIFLTRAPIFLHQHELDATLQHDLLAG